MKSKRGRAEERKVVGGTKKSERKGVTLLAWKRKTPRKGLSAETRIDKKREGWGRSKNGSCQKREQRSDGVCRARIYLVAVFLAVPIWVELTLVANRSEQRDSGM